MSCFKLRLIFVRQIGRAGVRTKTTEDLRKLVLMGIRARHLTIINRYCPRLSHKGHTSSTSGGNSKVKAKGLSYICTL